MNTEETTPQTDEVTLVPEVELTIQQIREELEGKEFTYYPVNKDRTPVKVKCVDGVLHDSETNEVVLLVGVRWRYVYDCYLGKVTEFKVETKYAAPSGASSSGPRTPRAPRSSVPAGPRYPQLGKLKEEPYPDGIEKDGEVKYMFWTTGSMKNLMRSLDPNMPNDGGWNPSAFVTEFLSQFSGPEDAKDSMVYLSEGALRAMYFYFEKMQVPEDMPSTLKNSATTCFKRSAQFLITKDGSLPSQEKVDGA